MSTVPKPTFQLSLLGRFELNRPDGRSIDLTSKKLAALLAFLACTAPQPHGRDKLILRQQRRKRQGDRPVRGGPAHEPARPQIT
jgi:hypothetical protein